VCDEPTSALDVSVQAQVLNIMKDLQRERGLTYLFISHNLAVVRHVSDQVGVMYLGRLVELAGKHQLFGRPRHPYTRMLLDAIPKMHDTGRARTPVQGEVPNPLNPPTGCAFHPRCPLANDRCKAERPQLLSIEGIKVACHAVEEGRDWPRPWPRPRWASAQSTRTAYYRPPPRAGPRAAGAGPDHATRSATDAACLTPFADRLGQAMDLAIDCRTYPAQSELAEDFRRGGVDLAFVGNLQALEHGGRGQRRGLRPASWSRASMPTARCS
jgi:oligopeptide/dipeptide ABC transporter ATP-binding protein